MARQLRLPLVIIAAAGLAAACDGTAAQPSAAGAAPATPPVAEATPLPEVTAVAPVDRIVATAPIRGSAQASPCCPMNMEIETNDPRVSGTGFFDLKANQTTSLAAFESGDFTLSNVDGDWAGWCSGAGWRAVPAPGAALQTYADVACWLEGSGGYDGLTYYQHLQDTGTSVEVTGVVLPLDAPTP